MSNDRTQQILSHFLAAETGAAPVLTKTAQDAVNQELAVGFIEALKAAGNTPDSIEKFASEQPQEYGALFTEWIGTLRQNLVKQAETDAMEKHAQAEYMSKVAEATQLGRIMGYACIDGILECAERLQKMAAEEEAEEKEKEKEEPKEKEPSGDLPPWLGQPKEASALPPEVIEAHNHLMSKMASGEPLSPQENDFLAKVLGAVNGLPITFRK